MVKKAELTPYVRGQVVGMYRAHAKTGKIAEEFGLPSSTVSTIIQRFKEDPNDITGASKKRAGRPPVIEPHGQRRLLRITMKDRGLPLQELTQNYNMASQKPVSSSTVRNYLYNAGIERSKAVKKPFLRPPNIDKRLQWCKERESWTAEDFRKVLWSDESTIELGKLNKDVYVWRREGERYKKECIVGAMKTGRISVMVWGCFIGTRWDL